MSSTIRDSRAVCCSMMSSVSRYSASSRCGCCSATLAAVRAVATGVRSSCDASAMNCRCWISDALEPAEQLVEGFRQVAELVARVRDR